LFVPAAQPVGHATIYVTAAGTSETFYTCIYNSSGTTLLWSTSMAVNSGSAAATGSAAQFTLLPNTLYLLTWEQAGATGSTLETYGISAAMASLLNKNATAPPRLFTTGNVESGGACPSTTGTLTASATTIVPQILLEP
jgi:hypothetical protein